MKGRERVDQFYLERRRRLVESFLEKVSGEEIARNSFSNNLILEGRLLIMLSSSLSSSLSILCFFWTFMFRTMASIYSVQGRRSTSIMRKKMFVEGVHFGEREGRSSGSGFRKVLLYIFFNILLTWKIVGVSKVLVLYVYIDKWYPNTPKYPYFCRKYYLESYLKFFFFKILSIWHVRREMRMS